MAKKKKKEFDLFTKKNIFTIILVAVAIISIGLVGALTGYFPLPEPSVTTTTTIPTTTTTTTTTTIPRIDITVKVVDVQTNQPISGAVIYLDGSDVGISGTDGTKVIKDVLKGSRRLEARYKEQIASISVNVYPDTFFEIKLEAPKNVLLTIKDEESNNFVDNVDVSLNGKLYGTTKSDGTLLVEDILPDSYLVTLGIPEFGNLDVGYENIGMESSKTILANMPKPKLTTSGKFETKYKYGIFDEIGKCYVEAFNGGEMNTKWTIAVCHVFEVEEGKTPNYLGSDIIRLGSIAKGESKKDESEEFDTRVMVDEDIVIVFYDSYEYIPETSSQDWAMRLNIPSSFVEEWMSDAKNWCAQEKEECAKVAGIFVGNIIKTVIG